jgi:ubiquinone/menaquinone biosynthesis C-methylase UbiE
VFQEQTSLITRPRVIAGGTLLAHASEKAGRSGQKQLKDTARTIFDGLATSYDKSLDYATLLQDRYWKNWLMARADLGRSQRVLDVGCGTCIFERLLQPFGCDVVALDLTEAMIRIGQTKVWRRGHLDLILGDAEALPFSDQAFDTVISAYVVKYCNTIRFVKELARVTRPRGKVLFYDFVRPRGPFSPALSLYVYGALGVVHEVASPVNEGVAYTLGNLPRIIRETTWNLGIDAQLEKAGLTVTERKTMGGGIVEALACLKSTAPPSH